MLSGLRERLSADWRESKREAFALVRRDPGIDIKAWILVVVYVIVLLLVVAKLFPELMTSLKSYNASDPSGFGSILQSLVPILIGVAILIVLVVYLLKQADVM